MAPLRPSPREQPTLCRRMPPPNVGATLVSPERPSQHRGRAPRNVGATLVSPGRPTQRRNWPETPRTPPRTMPRTGRAVPAPGVINGAPTSITARRPSQRHNWPASPRAGPRQMRQRARSKLLVTTDTDEKAMHAADTPGVSISPHTGKSAPAARGMPTAL